MNTTEFVQSWDAKRKVYVAFRVSTAEEIGTSAHPFKNMDEVEPLEVERPTQVAQSDPLGMFR